MASDIEVKELLPLTSSQTDQLVLLLDGIEEYSNTTDLFTSLESIGFTSKTHCITFFGRPLFLSESAYLDTP